MNAAHTEVRQTQELPMYDSVQHSNMPRSETLGITLTTPALIPGIACFLHDSPGGTFEN